MHCPCRNIRHDYIDLDTIHSDVNAALVASQ